MTSTAGTPYQVHIVPENSGLWKAKQTDAAAKKASELLQEDLEKHHVFFNQDGFHNHIPHHILALFGTGAGPASLQKGFDENANYQRPVLPTHERVLEDLRDWNHATKYLGKEQYYSDFLRYFQREIGAKGYEAVLSRYLFQGDEAADDMLVRLYSGFLHPLIQLMYGVEWKQPAIVAEALAQTAVHGNDIGSFLLDSEQRAKEQQQQASGQGMPTVVSLLEEIHANKKLATAARMEDGNKIRDGVMVRAKDEILNIAAKVRVSPDEIDEKTAEMFDACVYMTTSAAFHPGKQPKMDFFLIHHVNASPIFLALNSQDWISAETKARILEWKIRMDVIQYAARAAPPLDLGNITRYQPKKDVNATPFDTVSRLHDLPEDGHAIKLARAALICRDAVKPYEGKEWVKIRGDELWSKVYHLIVDSAEAPGPNWVRTAGLDEAWAEVPDLQDAKL